MSAVCELTHHSISRLRRKSGLTGRIAASEMVAGGPLRAANGGDLLWPVAQLTDQRPVAQIIMGSNNRFARYQRRFFMMLRWIGRIVAIAIFGYLGLFAYQYHRLGLFSMPDLPDGAYFVSFENWLRGIVLNADVPASSNGVGPKFLRSLSIENRGRKYLGIPSDVPPWFVDLRLFYRARAGGNFRKLA